MDIYKLFMLITVPVLAVAWLGYWLWNRRLTKLEKSQPRQKSERLQKTNSELDDWAQKIKESESPREQALRRRRELEAQRNKENQEKSQQ